MHKHRSGFTVIEMIMVIVVVGIVMTFALPYLRNSSAKASVRGAADEISRLYAMGRAVSIQRGKIAKLTLNSGASTAVLLAAQVGGPGWDQIGGVENLNSRYGVTFTTSTDVLYFSPRGIGTNLSNTQIIITNNGFTDTVTISPTGMIQR